MPSAQGWPALLLMVYSRDDNNRDAFVSYALVPLPNTPGTHKITARTWFAVEGNNALGRRFFGGCCEGLSTRAWLHGAAAACFQGAGGMRRGTNVLLSVCRGRQQWALRTRCISRCCECPSCSCSSHPGLAPKPHRATRSGAVRHLLA